jgi:HSP20 family protein
MVGSQMSRLLGAGSLDPWSLLEQLQTELLGRDPGPNVPKGVRIWTSDDAAQLEIDAPGVDASACDVSVHDQVVEVTVPASGGGPPEGARVHRAERARDGFTHRIRLPFSADGAKTAAVYERGVLRLTLHRRAETMPQKITIKAG